MLLYRATAAASCGLTCKDTVPQPYNRAASSQACIRLFATPSLWRELGVVTSQGTKGYTPEGRKISLGTECQKNRGHTSQWSSIPYVSMVTHGRNTYLVCQAFDVGYAGRVLQHDDLRGNKYNRETFATSIVLCSAMHCECTETMNMDEVCCTSTEHVHVFEVRITQTQN